MGGGGGGQTQQSNQYSSVSPWAQPYVGSILGAAQQQVFNMNPQGQITGMQGYTPYGYQGAGMSAADQAAAQASVAGFTPLQQQAFTGAANLQTPGQFGSATNLATQAGYGGLGAQGQAQDLMGGALGYGQAGSMYGAAGAQGAQQTSQEAQRQAAMYGRQAANVGMQGLGYGSQGAGYGAAAAGLAPAAQGYGQGAANIGLQGLGYGAAGQQAGLAGMQAGMGYGQQATNPAAVQAYMNPYLQASLDPQLAEIQRQSDITGAGLAGQAVKQGAFGGSRAALQQAENARNALIAKQQVIGQGYNQAFQNAQQQMQAAAQLGMQGAGYGLQGAQAGLSGLGTAMQGQQAGLAGLGQAGQLYGQGMQGAQTGMQGISSALAGLQGAQQGVGQQLSAGQLGLQGAQTGMQGAGYGLQGIQGALGAGQYGLSGLGLAGTQASNLANIGANQLAAQQGILGLQNQYGTQQQQQAQNVINQAMQNYMTAQQYPMTQLGQLKSLVTGLPITDTTTTQTQAAPSTTSQLAGLGTTGIAGLGLYNAMNK